MKAAKRLLPRVAAVLAALLAGLLLAEGAVRLLSGDATAERRAELVERRRDARELLSGGARDSFQGLFRDHPYLGYTLRPGIRKAPHGWEVETDRYGFRNEDGLDFRSLGDEVAVIGLFGGSAAFGWGIDGNAGTLASRLETLLSGGQGRPARVVNLAAPAWHYPQQWFLISRVIEDLDGIITYAGFNEIIVPLSNTFRTDPPLPADFPWAPLYLPITRTGNENRNLAMFSLLHYESAFAPEGILARSHLYLWMRHDRSRRMRERALRLVQGESVAAEGTRPAEPSSFPGTAADFDEVVGFGIGEYARYTEMVDLLAESRGVPVLHVLQPFLYADEEQALEHDVPEYMAILLEKGHPSRHYGRLRERFAELARSPRPGARYLDLADAIPADEENWIDMVHSSETGTALAAERIHSFLVSSGLAF